MTDCIKRKDAIKAITRKHDEVLSVAEAIEDLDEIPSADVVERKRGKWIDSKCSECGGLIPITKVLWHGEVIWETDYPMSRFCPNCGADMREES